MSRSDRFRNESTPANQYKQSNKDYVNNGLLPDLPLGTIIRFFVEFFYRPKRSKNQQDQRQEDIPVIA